MTARQVRAKPRRRYVVAAAAILLAYIGGLASPQRLFLSQETASPTLSPIQRDSIRYAGGQVGSALDMDEETLARHLFEAPVADRQQRLRELAAHYMAKGDYQRAIRCYSRMLDLLDSPVDAPDDNWLIMRLKEARTKEMNYEI